MPGFRMKDEDGTITQYTAVIRPFLTHEQSLPKYQGKASFEITEISFQTSLGTYLDSPRHRYPGGRDISEITLEEAIRPGIVIDARGMGEFDALGLDSMEARGVDWREIRGKAVLFNFGWDAHWGTERYYSYPFISEDLIDQLISSGARLVGVDTINVDDSRNPVRPAHTRFLKSGVLIVENLTGLDQLYGRAFRFFAVPWKARGVAALPVRAFAEVLP